MGYYISIRGSLQVSPRQAATIRRIVDESSGPNDDLSILTETYRRGWVIDSTLKGWSCYCFYGFDVRAEFMPMFRQWIDAIARLREEDQVGDEVVFDYPEGEFSLQYEDAAETLVWSVSGGVLKEGCVIFDNTGEE